MVFGSYMSVHEVFYPAMEDKTAALPSILSVDSII